jgi:putative transposase
MGSASRLSTTGSGSTKGLGVSELRRLRLLEEENRKLKQLVAELTLDKHILREVVKKKF